MRNTSLIQFMVIAGVLLGFSLESRVSAQQTVSTLVPVALEVSSGRAAGQPVTALATMHESGMSNDKKYVELDAKTASAPYAGTVSYTLPTTVPPLSVISMQIQADYRGPAVPSQRWTWKIFDWVNNAYVTVGDNTFAPQWGSWKVLSFNVWGNLANYVRTSDGAIKVQILSDNQADDAYIEYQPILVSSNAAFNPDNHFYYVAPGGKDSHAGTEAAPWKTIQHAANTVPPGSTVYVKEGIYKEQITVNVSGSAAKGFIRFQSYPGQKAVLDGAGVTFPADTDGGTRGLIQITDRSYITFEGFEVRNITPGTGFPAAISINGKSDHIQLRENVIHHVNNGQHGAHAIGVYGNALDGSINNLVIDGNQIFDLVLGRSEAIHIDGNTERWAVTNNQIHDADNIGIDALGFYKTSQVHDQARSGFIGGSLVYNINVSKNPVDPGGNSASGIYVDGGTDILIESNILHDNNIGLQISSETPGKLATNVLARNNVIYHNTSSGISMGGYSDSVGSTDHCAVVNNTLFENDSLQNGIGEVNLQYFPATLSGNFFENNLLYANDHGTIVSSYLNTPRVKVDHNLYFAADGAKDGSWIWNRKPYATLASWVAATNNDVHSKYDDPKAIDTTHFPPDMFLHSDSPALGAGANLSSGIAGAVDFNGHPRMKDKSVDVGAYAQ